MDPLKLMLLFGARHAASVVNECVYSSSPPRFLYILAIHHPHSNGAVSGGIEPIRTLEGFCCCLSTRLSLPICIALKKDQQHKEDESGVAPFFHLKEKRICAVRRYCSLSREHNKWWVIVSYFHQLVVQDNNRKLWWPARILMTYTKTALRLPIFKYKHKLCVGRAPLECHVPLFYYFLVQNKKKKRKESV